MQLPLVLMCAVVLLSFHSAIRGEDDFSGNGQLGDMDSSNTLVQNRIYVHSGHQQSTKDMIEDQANIPQIQPDHMNLMEETIGTLIQSSKKVEDMISDLDSKVDRILQTDNLQNGRSSANNNCDLMDSLEILNKLNNIHQYITSSFQASCRTKRPELLDPHQLAIIQNFMTAINNANRSLRNFSPKACNEVIPNSGRTMQYSEKSSRRYEGSSRQVEEEVGSNYRGSTNNTPCNKARSGRLNVSAAPKVNYRNQKRSTNGVYLEPNKYNCHELTERRNGVYKFASDDEEANDAGRFFYERYCDFDTDEGGAWTVIQKRFENNNPENFNRTWSDYKLGFGQLDKEFWFGNDFIHELTSEVDVELRIVLEDDSGRKEWAEFSSFKVDTEDHNYNLRIGGYTGSITNSFLYHNDQDFSTYDRRNDNNDNIPCASSHGNGWWFNDCTEPSNRDYEGIIWDNWLGNNFLKSSKMMIRPKKLWTGVDGYEKE